jgi:hypothetical protein
MDGAKGMAAGAAGGALGEVFAEAITNTTEVAKDIQSKNPHLTENDVEAWHRLFYKSTEGQRTWSQFLAGLTTGMFGGDFSTAHHTATTATENNFAFAIPLLLFEAGVISFNAYRAYRAASAAYTLYNLAEKVQDKAKEQAKDQ